MRKVTHCVRWACRRDALHLPRGGYLDDQDSQHGASQYEAFAELDVLALQRNPNGRLSVALGGLTLIGHVFESVSKSVDMIGVCCFLRVLSSRRVAERLETLVYNLRIHFLRSLVASAPR